MSRLMRSQRIAFAFAFALTSLAPILAHGQDAAEKAGVAVGVTAGNLWFIPLKAISVSMGILSTALSFVATGGDTALTQQIWQDTLQGPYLITPEVAKKSIGERPELAERK